MNIRNYYAPQRLADSNDGAVQQQNTQQVEEVVALTPPRVLGDAFHVMNRIKVPKHHDFKPSFVHEIRCYLRARSRRCPSGESSITCNIK